MTSEPMNDSVHGHHHGWCDKCLVEGVHRAATPAPREDGWDELRRLAEAATPGPWRSRKGYGPDKFAPKGYRYVLFGPGREEMYGTDQLKPEDAAFIVAAVNFVRDRLAAARGEPETLARAEYARLKGIEDIARLIVSGWEHGFPVNDGSGERELIDRLRTALGSE